MMVREVSEAEISERRRQRAETEDHPLPWLHPHWTPVYPDHVESAMRACGINVGGDVSKAHGTMWKNSSQYVARVSHRGVITPIGGGGRQFVNETEPTWLTSDFKPESTCLCVFREGDIDACSDNHDFDTARVRAIKEARREALNDDP